MDFNFKLMKSRPEKLSALDILLSELDVVPMRICELSFIFWIDAINVVVK
jgi:hypothetical protein